MARATPMVALGYGKFVRADRVYALVPLEGEDRGDGRRTLVHVDGIEQPLIASRSEAAIAHDMAEALGHVSGARGRRGDGGGAPRRRGRRAGSGAAVLRVIWLSWVPNRPYSPVWYPAAPPRASVGAHSSP